MSDALSPELREALEEVFGLPSEQLTPQARLQEDLALDSLSIVELQVVLEEKLGVRLAVEDPASVQTLADLQKVMDTAVETGIPVAPTLDLTDPAA